MKRAGKKKAPRIKEETKLTLDDVRERLWRAIPCVAEVINEESDVIKIDGDGLTPSKVQPLHFNDCKLSLSTMEHIVRCLYMVTHGNPLPEDVHQAVVSVFSGLPLTREEFYTKKDLYKFLDTIPGLWLSHVVPSTDESLVLFNQNLVECITTDDLPSTLIDDPWKTLLFSLSPSDLTMLRTPVASFVSLSKQLPHTHVFYDLWVYIQSTSSTEPLSRTAIECCETLTLTQFNVFFKWFINLHFSNPSAPRVEVGGRNIWLEFLNEKGIMDMESFKRACDFILRCYAQQSDTTNYLERLLSITQAQMKSEDRDGLNPLTEMNAEKIQTDWPRRRFEDCASLYMPEELRRWRQEHIFYNRRPTENRILIHGPRFIGKTTIGKALAEKLHVIHLDVLELALKSIVNASSGDELGQKLEELTQNSSPIPLSLQAALVRREVESRGEYEGYVFSDSLYVTAKNRDVITQFIEECGLVRVAIPSVFLEVSSSDTEWVHEIQKVVTSSRHSTDEALRTAYRMREQGVSEDDKKPEMPFLSEQAFTPLPQSRADENIHNKILHRAEESILSVDNEDQDKSRSRTAGHTPAPNDTSNAGAEDDVQHLRWMLNRLIEAGRTSFETASEEVVGHAQLPLTRLPALALAVERATLRDTVLTVEATSTVEDILTYVTESLDLQPTFVVEEVVVPVDMYTELSKQALDEKVLSQFKEETAFSKGFQYSPTWKRFCPVTNAIDGVLVEGSPLFSCIVRSYLYIMASRDKLEQFKRNPLFYLRRIPVRQEPIYIVASAEELQRCYGNGSIGFELPSLIKRLAHSLQLTVVTFPDYAFSYSQYLELSNKRQSAFLSRVDFTKEERQKRCIRLEKRLRLEAKRKGASSAVKPKVAKLSNKKNSTIFAEPEMTPPRVTFMMTQQPESMAGALEQQIEKLKENQKRDVPVLVTTLNLQDHIPEKLELLLKEKGIPKSVLVIRCGTSHASPAQVSESDAHDKQLLNDSEPGSLVWSYCNEIVESIRAHEGNDDNDSLESVRIHEIDASGMSEQDILWHIWQLVSPAAVQAVSGIVDGSLGEEEEEEEDNELINDNGEEPDEEKKSLRVLLDATKKVASFLKPGRRFLHQFGTCLQYCPVTLHTRHLLVRGKSDLCLSFLGDLYCFASIECLDQFRQNPLRFINNFPPKNTPLRLWMVGALFSGRHTLSSGICREFSVPFFTYDSIFLEKCIEAASTPGGANVGEIFIPEADLSRSAAAARGAQILHELRDFASDHEKRLKLRDEAQRELEEMEQNAELPQDDEQAAAREAELQAYLEFVPEDEEDKRDRLNEAYLRMLSCVTRIEPFESKGYIMICSPFSGTSVDVLFEENCIPEAVVYLEVQEDTYKERARKAIEQRQKETVFRPSEAQIAQAQSIARLREDELERRKRERALYLWRRRHIGVEEDSSVAGLGFTEVDSTLNDPERRSDELQNEYPGQDLTVPSFRAEVDVIEEFLEAVEEHLVEVVRVPGNGGPETVLRTANEILQRHLCNRLSFFCAGRVVDYDLSQQLVKNGQVVESCFGRVDPVELFERRMGVYQPCRHKPTGDCRWYVPELLPEATLNTEADDTSNEGETVSSDLMEEEMSEYDREELGQLRSLAEQQRRQWDHLMSPHSVLFADRIYYFKKYSTLGKFLRNPILYVSQPPPLPKLSSMPAVAILAGDIFEPQYAIRDDGVKRRSLAESVAYNLNAVLISIPKLLSWAALHPRLGSLSTRAIDAAFSGFTDYALIQRLFAIRLGGADVKWRGAIVSDWPRDVSKLDQIIEHPIPTLLARIACVGDAQLPQLAYTPFTLYATIQKRLNELLLYTEDVIPANPVDPNDPVNLIKLVRDIEALIERGRKAVLCRRFAFPISAAHLWSIRKEVVTHMSPFQWYCPYSWLENNDLVDSRFCDGLWVAEFLGEYYFFSNEEYLQRFLLDPHMVTEPAISHPLPSHLPTRILRTFSPEEATSLALQGCCPVLLYDTRDNHALRGLKEPIAKLGLLSCVVEYKHKYYACLDDTNRERFLKRPWQYIDAEVPLPPPHKCPLFYLACREKEEVIRRSMDEATYIKRYLYDAVSRAILAVAEVRPMYPGLSVEESVLKYMSLYLKVHREDVNEQQRKQYVENLNLFTKRSTLYKHIALSSLDASEEKTLDVRKLCDEYDMIQKGVENVSEMGHLKMHSNVKQ